MNIRLRRRYFALPCTFTLVLFYAFFLAPAKSEALCTLSWESPATNADGTPLTDLAGYKIYYDTDSSGPPYDGKSLSEGNSPILLPLAAVHDPSNPSFSLSGLTAGKTYHITVTAYDKNLNESAYPHEVTAEKKLSSNSPPIADAGADQQITRSDLSSGSVAVTLDGSASTDPDGDPITYSWTQTQGSAVNLMGKSTAKPFFSATSAFTGQTLAFRLVTSDGQLSSSPDSVLVLVKEVSEGGNDPPIAHIGATPTEGMAPLTVSFSGTGTDTDGTITDYNWSFGDGSSANAQNTTHLYTAPGSYTVTLTVTDNDGAQGSASLTIQAAPPSSDQDSDEDGMPDAVEMAYGLDPLAQDSDGDGISDFIEWGPGAAPLDSDGDGTVDALDTDSDNDTKPDQDEGVADDDADGALNYCDMDDTDGPEGDQDGDGIINATEVTYMMNPNLSDTDGDAIDDPTEFGVLPWPVDTDADETIDALDADSDNDGKSDQQEGTADTDGDGAPNYVDIDDGDGPEGDQDGDGIKNSLESATGLNPNLSDSDQDGIPDMEEAENIQAPTDTDGDGIIDALDPDADDDGIPDIEEFREDLDENGLADRKDATTATFRGKLRPMSLKLATPGCRLTGTKYIPEARSTNAHKPARNFNHGGLQYMVNDVPEGGTVDIQIMITRKFRKNTQYWKSDEIEGYSQMESTVEGNTLMFSLVDGGTGDADGMANGVIDDPGFIQEPGMTDTESPGNIGGGGGGCGLNPGPSNSMGGVIIILPALVLFVIRKRRKT